MANEDSRETVMQECGGRGWWERKCGKSMRWVQEGETCSHQ